MQTLRIRKILTLIHSPLLTLHQSGLDCLTKSKLGSEYNAVILIWLKDK